MGFIDRLLMEDRFGHHSLEILARFGITKYMSIAEAIQAIELLIQQTKECALLIPKDSWDLVGSYLAPMTIVKTNVEVKPEAKENLSHMKQFSSAEIIQQVRDDKRKAKALKTAFEETTDLDDETYKNKQILDLLYARSILYHSAAKTKIYDANLLLKDEDKTNVSIKSVMRRQAVLAEISQAETLNKKAISFHNTVSLFRTNATKKMSSLLEKINEKSEVEKNTAALTFIRSF